MFFRSFSLSWLIPLFGPGLAFGSVSAQIEGSRDYLVHVWQTDSGLPQNWVSSIAQTADGYLWIGTRYGGLARFDGTRFVHFNPQNTPELRDVQVERLTVDREGTLWIVMANQSVTALRQGRFELLHQPRAEPELRLETVLFTTPEKIVFNTEAGEIAEFERAQGLSGWRVTTPQPAARAFSYNIFPAEVFQHSKAGELWYVDQNRQASRFSLQARTTEPAGESPLRNVKVNALATDSHGRLWAVAPQKILSWDGTELRTHSLEGAAPLGDVRQIAFSGDGALWLCGPRGLRRFFEGSLSAPIAPERLRASLSSRHYKIYGDSAGGAWIPSYGHGLLHARPDGTLQQLSEQDGLPSEMITCWFEDKESNVWVGTAGGGLARVRERVFRMVGPADGLPEKVVCSVAVDSAGEVWTGTMSGQLARWDGKKFSVFPLPQTEATPIGGIAVWPAGHGSVWIGSLYHGLLRLDNGQITRPVETGSLRFVRVFFQDSKGTLWIGGLGGLRCLAGNEFRLFGAEDGFRTGIAIGAIAEGPTGDLWVGTGSGDLWRYRAGVFTHFPLPAEWPSSRCVSLRADADGIVWIGTLGNGLLRFADGRFTRFRTQEGLLDNNVTQLLEDEKGDLWGGTYSGIFRVKKSELADFAAGKNTKLTWSSYGKPYGLPALECTAGFNPACWRAEDGRLWFSTVNGLISVNPSAVSSNRRPPDVIIEELQIDSARRPLSVAEQHAQEKIEISPGRHFLQFRYTGLSFSAPDEVRFRWRGEGIDRRRQDSGTQRVIGFGPLAPGDYQLQVHASNADGVWNDSGATVAFTVLPFFWETVWFKVVFASAILALLGTIVAIAQRNRYRRRLQHVERQRELERERTRIARDLHDDLGTSLTQISMLGALANRDQAAPPQTRQLIQQMHGRAREMVTALDEIVWAVNPKNDSWSELANYLAYFAEEFFRPTKIRCRLDISEHLPSRPLSAEARHHLFLAFKEAINNVARHSEATFMHLRIEVAPGYVVLSVEDDGRGIPDQGKKARTGNGLVNMQRRMEQIGGSADVLPRPGGGTRVVFSVPSTR